MGDKLKEKTNHELLSEVYTNLILNKDKLGMKAPLVISADPTKLLELKLKAKRLGLQNLVESINKPIITLYDIIKIQNEINSASIMHRESLYATFRESVSRGIANHFKSMDLKIWNDASQLQQKYLILISALKFQEFVNWISKMVVEWWDKIKEKQGMAEEREKMSADEILSSNLPRALFLEFLTHLITFQAPAGKEKIDPETQAFIKNLAWQKVLEKLPTIFKLFAGTKFRT